MNTSPKTALVSLALALLAPMAARADDSHHQQPGTVAPAAAGDMTDGEVRKVDTEAGRLTLKHADIKSLDMPAMTMVFSVKEKALLDKLKVGDKVKFKAVNENGKLTVVAIQPAS
jgi:Cu/Ag efflux protein CusF